MESILIKRIELYNKVWSKPMTKLAKEYGISDVGLSKICKKMDIPKPYPGYWAKLEFGKPVKKIPLPEATNDTIQEYELIVNENKGPDFPSSLNRKLSINTENKIKVYKKLTNPHPLIQTAQNKLINRSSSQHGLYRTKYLDIIDIRVTPKTLNRSLRIMDAIIKEGIKRKWEIPAPGYDSTGFLIDGSSVYFLLREKLKIIKTTSTSPWSEHEHKYITTGKLSLEIIYWSSSNGIKKIFTDKNNSLLENQLNHFFDSIIKIAYIQKQNDLEAERKAKEKQRRRDQILVKLNAIAEEEKRIDKLREESKLWNDADSLRKFINAVEENFSKEDNAVYNKVPLTEWINWATKIADRIDPLIEDSKLLLDDKEKYLKMLNDI